MKILNSPQEMKNFRKSVDKSVGFVPTMGALHQGHAELLKKARSENEILGLSIFVNPTQFNNPQDLKNYPKTWEADLEIAKKMGVDFIFAPTFEVMYPDNYHYKLSENDKSLLYCGKDRPGHFDGVLTVVMKLLNCVEPHRAYFGEKDFQQLQLVKGMVDAFFMNCEIVPVATIREQSGLALSSRNVLLTDEEKRTAPQFYEAIKNAPSAAEARHKLEQQGIAVDYIEDWNHRRLGAIRLGQVRLIDNVEIGKEKKS